MTTVFFCLGPLASITPSPRSSDAQSLRCVINQAEYYYGEMFVGMTVLYALIAAIFGYLILGKRLKSLHKKIKAARDAAQNAITQISETESSLHAYANAMASGEGKGVSQTLTYPRRAGPLIATCNPHLRYQPPSNTGKFSIIFRESSSGSGEFQSLICCKAFTYGRAID